MKKVGLMGVVMMMVFVLSACQETGLSQRETGDMTYTDYLYSMMDEHQARGGSVVMTRPMRLAVAQIGEHTAPQKFFESLKESRLFSNIVSIPAHQQVMSGKDNSAIVAKNMKRMIEMSGALDAEYLFVFGGNADYGADSNTLEILDLTIVGAYLFPSKDIKAEAKAAGALLDVKTGQVILTVSADGSAKTKAPSATQEGATTRILTQLREDLMDQLGKKLVKEIQEYGNRG